MAIRQIHLTDNYNTSPFSAEVRDLRQRLNDYSGVNYATFWYGSPHGVTTYTWHSDEFHSEKEVWLGIAATPPLTRLLVPHWPQGQQPGANQTADNLFRHQNYCIGAVYTERQPCGNCKPFLDDILPDDAPVYYHVPYLSPETSKYKHDDDTSAVIGLLALEKSPVHYVAPSAADYKKYRADGNRQLKQELKGMQEPGGPLVAYAQTLMALKYARL